MPAFFSKELLDSCICSTEDLATAKKYGKKCIYEEFGFRQTSYFIMV